MQARRLLLVIGTVMLLAVVAASLVPPPEDAQDDGAGEEDRTATADPAPSPPTEPAGAVEVKFDAVRSSDPSGRPQRGQNVGQASKTQTVRLDERVIVTVAVPKPGRVELEGLGLLQTATPGTPALFDLFTDRAGRFAVLYTPAEGDDRVVGTLAVEPAREGQAS